MLYYECILLNLTLLFLKNLKIKVEYSELLRIYESMAFTYN